MGRRPPLFLAAWAAAVVVWAAPADGARVPPIAIAPLVEPSPTPPRGLREAHKEVRRLLDALPEPSPDGDLSREVFQNVTQVLNTILNFGERVAFAALAKVSPRWLRKQLELVNILVDRIVGCWVAWREFAQGSRLQPLFQATHILVGKVVSLQIPLRLGVMENATKVRKQCLVQLALAFATIDPELKRKYAARLQAAKAATQPECLPRASKRTAGVAPTKTLGGGPEPISASGGERILPSGENFGENASAPTKPLGDGPQPISASGGERLALGGENFGENASAPTEPLGDGPQPISAGGGERLAENTSNMRPPPLRPGIFSQPRALPLADDANPYCTLRVVSQELAVMIGDTDGRAPRLLVLQMAAVFAEMREVAETWGSRFDAQALPWVLGDVLPEDWTRWRAFALQQGKLWLRSCMGELASAWTRGEAILGAALRKSEPSGVRALQEPPPPCVGHSQCCLKRVVAQLAATIATAVAEGAEHYPALLMVGRIARMRKCTLRLASTWAWLEKRHNSLLYPLGERFDSIQPVTHDEWARWHRFAEANGLTDAYICTAQLATAWSAFRFKKRWEAWMRPRAGGRRVLSEIFRDALALDRGSVEAPGAGTLPVASRPAKRCAAPEPCAKRPRRCGERARRPQRLPQEVPKAAAPGTPPSSPEAKAKTAIPSPSRRPQRLPPEVPKAAGPGTPPSSPEPTAPPLTPQPMPLRLTAADFEAAVQPDGAECSLATAEQGLLHATAALVSDGTMHYLALQMLRRFREMRRLSSEVASAVASASQDIPASLPRGQGGRTILSRSERDRWWHIAQANGLGAIQKCTDLILVKWAGLRVEERLGFVHAAPTSIARKLCLAELAAGLLTISPELTQICGAQLEAASSRQHDPTLTCLGPAVAPDEPQPTAFWNDATLDLDDLVMFEALDDD